VIKMSVLEGNVWTIVFFAIPTKNHSCPFLSELSRLVNDFSLETSNMLMLKVACVICCLNYGRHKFKMFQFFVTTIGFACHLHKNSLYWGVCRNFWLITTVLSLCTIVIIRWLYWLTLNRNFVIHLYLLWQLYKKKYDQQGTVLGWDTPSWCIWDEWRKGPSRVKLFFLCNNKDILVAYQCNNCWF
jgi:hypothetical protein